MLPALTGRRETEKRFIYWVNFLVASISLSSYLNLSLCRLSCLPAWSNVFFYFFFVVVITVASQSVLVSRLRLFSVSANTATCNANRCCKNSPYSIENTLAACQEGGWRMWRSRPRQNQTLASSRYLNWDTEYSLLRPPTLNSVLKNNKYACYLGNVTAVEFCKYLQNHSSSNPIKTLPYLKSCVSLDVTLCRLVNIAEVSEERNAY